MKRYKQYLSIYIIIMGVLIAGSIIAALSYKAYKEKARVDDYGYIHTSSTYTNIDYVSNMENNSSDYVINVPKNMEEAFLKSIDTGSSGYEFLSYALPYVMGGKEYTIFKFSDDTGLYMVRSNTASAIYGEVEGDEITQDIGYITISGMNMLYEPIPDYASKESRALAKLIPDEFRTDGLYVRVSETEAFICVKTDKSAENAANKVYAAVKDGLGDLPLIVLVNDSFKFEYCLERASEVSDNLETCNDDEENVNDVSGNIEVE